MADKSFTYTWVDFIFLKAYDWLTSINGWDSRWEPRASTAYQGQS